MFENYLNYIQKAKQDEQDVNQKYEKLKKELSISIREKIIDILDGDDFLVVNHINSVAEMIDQYKKADKEHLHELAKIKERLDINLSKYIKINTFISSRL